jgi:hypothetical protein
MIMVLDYIGPTTTTINGHTCENLSCRQHRNQSQGTGGNAFGDAMATMLRGWEAYAAAHRARYSEDDTDCGGIGDDYVIGPYWAEVGIAIHRLLDGDTGGFDCGSISGNIHKLIQSEGLTLDDDGELVRE